MVSDDAGLAGWALAAAVIGVTVTTAAGQQERHGYGRACDVVRHAH
jgi:hypothetical protein